MVTIDENIDTDRIIREASSADDDGGGGGSSGGGGGSVDISGGEDPGDITVNIGDGGGGDEDGGSVDIGPGGDVSTIDEGGPGGGGSGGGAQPPTDEQQETSDDDGEGDGGVDFGPGGDVSTVDEGGPSGGGTGGGTQPASAQDPGDVRTQPIVEQARRDELASRVRNTPSGGGRAEDLTSADIEQFERDIMAERVREATPGPGEDPTGVDVMQFGGGPEPGDVRVEPGAFARPRPPTGPRPVEGQGLEAEEPRADEQVFIIDDPRPNRGEFRGTRREIAQLIEEIVLEEERTLSPEDVAVVETDEGLGVRFTTVGIRKQFAANQAGRDVGRAFRADQATTGRVGALGAITTGVESDVEAQRALAALDIEGGESPGDIRVEMGEDTAVDLAVNEDFTVEPVFGRPGRFRAELTEGRRREEAAFAFEEALANEGKPVKLDAERDIKLTETGAALSEEGEKTVATSDAGPLQSDIDLNTLRVVAPSDFGSALLDRREGDIPLPAGTAPGTDVRIPIGDDAESIAFDVDREVSKRVFEPAAEAVGDVESIALTSPGATGQALARGKIPAPILPPGVATTPIDVPVPEPVSTFAAAEVRGAGALLNPGASAKSTIDALEFGKAGGEALAAGEFGVTPPGIDKSLNISPVVIEDEGFARDTADAVDRQIREAVKFAKEDPVEFAGGATGALVASGAVFGGAGALGRGPGFVSRLAIQPGEEALGIAGSRGLRALGRPGAARRLFPQEEPLIFSEEAAIRGAQIGARRAADLSRGIRTKIPEGRLPSAESVRTEIRSAPVNLAIARANLKARLRGESTSFRQRAVRGELEAEDVQAIAAEEVDVPTRGVDEPDADGGNGGMTVGGRIDIEHRTDSGVVVERVRLRGESETDARAMTEQELEALRETAELETEATRRLETNLEGVGQTPVESVALDELAEMREIMGEMSEFEIEGAREFAFESVAETETETIQEIVTETEVETELELELEQETELELEQELELEFETEQEIETELGGGPEDPRQQFGRTDPLGLFDERFEASVATPEEILGSDIDAVDADIDADAAEAGSDLADDLAAVDEDLAEVFDADGP